MPGESATTNRTHAITWLTIVAVIGRAVKDDYFKSNRGLRAASESSGRADGLLGEL